MTRPHPKSTRTDTLCPYTTLFRSQFSNITLGHRGIPKSAQCNAYQRVIDVGDNGVHIQLPRPILPGLFDPVAEATAPPCVQVGIHGRSEEHTSELQSLMRISYAVFCLKKKKKRDIS